jgi:hypothetical protein
MIPSFMELGHPILFALMGYTQIGDETGVKLGLKRGCDFRGNSTN